MPDIGHGRSIQLEVFRHETTASPNLSFRVESNAANCGWIERPAGNAHTARGGNSGQRNWLPRTNECAGCSGARAGPRQRTIVIRDGIIKEVSRDGEAPAGARIWDLSGHTVYPGFIDAHADLGMDAVPEGGAGPTHWNPQVRAWFSTTANLQDDSQRRAALRSQGSNSTSSARSGNLPRNWLGCESGDAGVRERVLAPDMIQAIGFQRCSNSAARIRIRLWAPRLMKQTLMDADWYIRAWDAYESSGRSFLPPETSEALDALESVVQGGQPVVFETSSEEEYLRAHAIASEFGVQAWYRGRAKRPAH